MNMPVRSLADIMPLLPELVVVVGAFALLMLDLFVEERNRIVSHVFSILVVAVATALIAFDVGGHGTVLSGMFVRDTAADVLKLGIGVVGILSLIYTWPYLRARGLYKGEVSVLMLFAIAGMMFLVSAGSLTMVYVGLEMLALCSYALVAVDRDSPLASEAAIKYFVLGALASGLLLYGMSMIYGATGTLDLSKIHAVASIASGSPHELLLAFGVVFIVVGIAFKFGAAPFHMWLPDVYEGSPTAVTIFIGSAPKIAAFGMAYRLLEDGLAGMQPHWHAMLGLLAVLSLGIGNLFAIAQTNLKRMLAYSTISHVGFLLLGLANGTPLGYAAAMFYAIAYAIMTTAAFGAILLLARAGFEAEEIDDFKGLNQRNPWYAFIVLLVMASLAGIPPLFGFFSKLLVLKAAIDADMLWLAIVAIVFAIVGAFYYLRVIKVMYFDAPIDKSPLQLPADLELRWLLSANGIALLVLGVAWGPLISWCYAAMGAH